MVLNSKYLKGEGFDFLNLVLLELKKLNQHPINPWINFSVVHYRFGTIFHFNKQTTWKLLFLLRDCGLIEINRIKGVKIRDEI